MDGRKTVWQYIKGYRFNSLLIKNFIYVFVLVIIPLLFVLGLNYDKFNEVVNNRVMVMNEDLLQKNAVVTENIMAGLLDGVSKMSQQNSIKEIAEKNYTDADYDEKARNVVSELQVHVSSNSMIVSAAVFSDATEMLIDQEGRTLLQNVPQKDKWYYIHKQKPLSVQYMLVSDTNSIFVCQPIWSDRGQRIGLFVEEIELKNLRDVLESHDAAQRGVFFVMDISGQVIYLNEQKGDRLENDSIKNYEQDIAAVKTGESRLVTDHGKRIVSVSASKYKSWQYAYVTELPDYKEETNIINTFLISSITVSVILGLVAAYIITVFTYRPVRKIIKVIQNPQLHWNEKEASKQSNEMLYIASHILADEDADTEISQNLGDRIRSLRQAQFRALQFQIDPHFLYNTLETIKWNAVEEMGLGNKTSKMLTKVARLYRLGLENDDVIVSLKEELDFLKLYIEIVQIRFGEAIQFHWDIDKALYDSSVIKMCLQPIVENAIQHGLRPVNYTGNITVSARQENDRLYISVKNDGQVMSRQEMKKLNEKMKTGAGFDESKVGLRNVNERIKLIYGKKYGVSIHDGAEALDDADTSGRNMQVVLTFPCRNMNRSEESK